MQVFVGIPAVRREGESYAQVATEILVGEVFYQNPAMDGLKNRGTGLLAMYSCYTVDWSLVLTFREDTGDSEVEFSASHRASMSWN